MARFPDWQSYQPPPEAALARLAAAHRALREAEVSDVRSPLDNRTAVRIFLYQQGVRGELFERLVEPFDLGFYLRSDGKSTPVPSLRLRGAQAGWGFCKDIVAVRHDLDYYRGMPERGAADRWYRSGQRALGESAALATAEYLGLRAVGWVAWDRHARLRRSQPGYGSDPYIHRLPRVRCEPRNRS